MRRETGDTIFSVFSPSSCCFFYIISTFMFVCFCTHCDTSLESRDSAQGRVLEGTLLGEFSAVHAYLCLHHCKTEKQKTDDQDVIADMNNATTCSLFLTLLTLVLKPSQWM
ncbi:hypothetical protein AMECASPLE_006958 [Ameca splendens]|uniref:Uncharacterized protein n=1 Tax=Ameca splendens TaxID=208324 RepID=A0ABV0YAL2_9TELE